jgi:hypothetical protein
MYCSPAALLPAESSKTIEILHFAFFSHVGKELLRYLLCVNRDTIVPPAIPE